MTLPSSVHGEVLEHRLASRQEHSKVAEHAPPWHVAQLPDGPPHTVVGIVAPR
jgi:hypothetical protein